MFYLLCSTMLLVLLLCLNGLVNSELYRGKHLGKLNSFHHQVSGDVYAVNEFTLLLTDFSYDGNGDDAFFWAGPTNRVGPQGFIVPDENGRTNVLARYLNKDFTLTLPDKKKVTDIKWFAIYDLTSQLTFGAVYVAEEFEAPSTQTIGALSRKSHGVASGPIQIVDAKTIIIPDFTYNGAGTDTYFWVGNGAQPSSKGMKVPDEYGYLEPLRTYLKETITIELPGDLTVFDINWLSVYDVESKQNFGSALIPDNPNVPPSLVKIIPHKKQFPSCLQLHKDYQVSWEIFDRSITFQLSAVIPEKYYLAFGVSGSGDKFEMVGSDITIAHIDGLSGGVVADYNVTANSPCVKVLGQYKGACKDELVGGMDNNQLHSATVTDGVSIITYRRELRTPDAGDREFVVGENSLIWAIGLLDEEKEPSFPDLWPRKAIRADLNKTQDNCFAFTTSNKPQLEAWDRPKIIDRALRVYTATLGPSGGKRGYRGITGMPSSGLAWYINSLMIPEIWMKRGFTYAIHVHGGNNPRSPEYYNPFIITDEPRGGIERREDKASHVRILAGVQYTLRRVPRPTSAGPLCLSRHNGVDRRLDDNFQTFRAFNKSLSFGCEEGDPAVLEVTPNTSWPDIVYYNSYTHTNMGWKIHIVDSFNLPISRASDQCSNFVLVAVLSISLILCKR